MCNEQQQTQLLHLEALIQETAGNANKTRLLAERILHELNGMAPTNRRYDYSDYRSEAVNEADAEPAWRLAA